MRSFCKVVPALVLVAAVGMVTVPLIAQERAAANNAFEAALKPYEEIRLLLLADQVEGVGEKATVLQERLLELKGTDEELDALLPKILPAVKQLRGAEDLASAREAFYALSKPLVRYHGGLEEDGSVIAAYCAMARKSWLQPAEEKIGNPYHGQAMATCGEVVSQ